MKTKKIIPLLIAAFVLMFVQVSMATDKYVESMQKNIQIVYTAQTIPDLQNAVNAFERIGSAEKTKWEPFYYASFGYIMMANQEKDNTKKDVYLDQALASVGKAKELVSNEAEVIALEGFVHMLRIGIDPGSRGQKYSSMAYQSFGKAKAISPENPRVLALLAQMQYGTAQFFNSSTAEACGTLNKALEKFATFKSDNPLAPQWGKGMAEGMKQNCK